MAFIGLFFSLGNIMSSLFSPIGIAPVDVAMIGLIMLGSGVVGAAASGWFLDKTQAYKKLILVLLGFSGVAFALVC